MTKLTDRLLFIADEIKENETMADIGTDHGFLPAYLVDSGVCPRAILTDVSEGSLAKARENVTALQTRRAAEGRPLRAGAFDFRLGDGLGVLAPGEAEVIVIAGMGGILISGILENAQAVARAARLILPPRNGTDKLRFYLLTHGFTIEKEILAREGKFICETIVARYDAQCGAREVIPPSGDPSYEIPKQMLENGALAAEYIARKIRANERILDEMTRAKRGRPESASLIERKLAYYRKMLQKAEIKEGSGEKQPGTAERKKVE